MLLLIVLALAVHQIVNVMQRGAPLSGYRNWIDMGCLPSYWIPELIRNHLRALQHCPWCLSINIGLLLSVLTLLPGVEWVLYGLAASQLANLIHHLFNQNGPRGPVG